MSVRPPELPIPGWALRLGARPASYLSMPEARLAALIAGPSGARDVRRNVKFWRSRQRDGLVALSEGTRLVVGHDTALRALRHPDAGNSRSLVESAPPKGAYDRLGRGSIAYVDGPDHRHLRKVVGPHLDREAAEARSDAIRDTICARMAEVGLNDGGSGAPDRIEVMGTVIRPVVESLVGDLCGIGPADRRQVAEWMATAELRWRRTPFVGPGIRRRSDRGLEAFGDWLRRVSAAGELSEGVFASLMADADPGSGAAVDGDAAVGTAFFVYGAARVTVERFLGSALRTLGDPALVARGGPPEVTPQLFDELLRWDPPAAVAARVTEVDLTFGDTLVGAGTQLVVLMRAVNRDPDVFDSPDTFVADRHPNPHLAFSAGAHYCLGAPLARVEGSVILEEMLGRLWPYRIVEKATEAVGLPHRPITSLVVGRR